MEESVTGEFPYERTEERVGDEDSRRRSGDRRRREGHKGHLGGGAGGCGGERQRDADAQLTIDI